MSSSDRGRDSMESSGFRSAPALDLPFTTPITNAAGFLGYSPKRRDLNVTDLGAFITNPISMHPRRAANSTRLIRFAGGILLHTGHPNPGLSKTVSKHRSRWAHSKHPVIVHLAPGDPDETYRMVRLLEETEAIDGLEIGLEAGVSNDLARGFIEAAVGELPVMVRPVLEDVLRLAEEAAEAGASALVIGPARGALFDAEGDLVAGRLYGPALRPQAMHSLRELVHMALPIVYSGGVIRAEDAYEVLDLGAAGVQVDIALWKTRNLKFPAEWSSVPD